MQMNLLRKVSLLEFRAASSMRENCTYGSMRGSRRKTAKSVLRVVEDRAGVPDKGRSALLYTLFDLLRHHLVYLVKGRHKPSEHHIGEWNRIHVVAEAKHIAAGI